MPVIPITIALVFAFLAFLHFYWAIFGIKKPELVLPSQNPEKEIKLPGSLMTVFVGFGLLLFAFIFLSQALGFWNVEWLHYIRVVVGVIFLIRAIGDFKYLGFFKSVKETPFAKMDTKYYAPICLALAILIALSMLVP